MRHLLPIFFFILYLSSSAQTPNSFKFQTSIRDNNGNLLANKLVALKISLIKGSQNGNDVYVEIHNTATTDFGIANIQIGNGTLIQGNFNSIDWSDGPYFLKTELDINNGSNFLFMGTTQLLSVPFALFAAKAGIASDDKDKDSTNEIQQLSLTNNQLQLNKNGGSINLEKYIDNTDSQTLTLQGNTLKISGGNSIILAGAVDLDSDPTNEIQSLTLSKDTVKLSQSNFIVLPADADRDSLNELQMLSKVGDTISISKGNSIILSKDNDRDSLNELQNIYYSNDTLYLSKGNYTILPKTYSVPTGTILTLDTFDSSLLNKGYTYVGRNTNNIQTIKSDSATWQWYLPISNLGIDGDRKEHSIAVWTGSEMIVIYKDAVYSDFKKYNPQTQSWSKISDINGPSSTIFGCGAWNGMELLFWRSMDSNKIYKYNPTNDIWTFVTPTNILNTPGMRYAPTAVWSGNDLIIWGGGGPNGYNSGKKYNVASNSWISMSNLNSPAVFEHIAVWTGNEMLVWGGTNTIGGRDSIIYKYNNSTNSWTQIVGLNSPTPRKGSTAVWTGSEMLVFGGGKDNYNYCQDKTYLYKPSNNTWYRIDDNNIGLSPREFSLSVWTGTEMIIWGGATFDWRNTRGNIFNEGQSLKLISPTFGFGKYKVHHIFRKN